MIEATKFLIIDDDSDDREMFCEAIHAIAPEAICDNATNGLKALTALQKAEIGNPDIIFFRYQHASNQWMAMSFEIKRTGSL